VTPAVIVDIDRGAWFEHPIPDPAFRELFYQHGGNRPDFPVYATLTKTNGRATNTVI
jgi:hypothetical protein